MPPSPLEDGAKLRSGVNNMVKNPHEKNISSVKVIETLPAIKEEANKVSAQSQRIVVKQENFLSKNIFKVKEESNSCSTTNVVHRNKSLYQALNDSKNSRPKSLFDIGSDDTSPWLNNSSKTNEVTKIYDAENKLFLENKDSTVWSKSNSNKISLSVNTFSNTSDQRSPNNEKGFEITNNQETRNKKPGSSSSFHEYNASNRIPLRERLAMKEKEKEEARNIEIFFESQNSNQVAQAAPKVISKLKHSFLFTTNFPRF